MWHFRMQKYYRVYAHIYIIIYIITLLYVHLFKIGFVMVHEVSVYVLDENAPSREGGWNVNGGKKKIL